jgi:hypothetical protein
MLLSLGGSADMWIPPNSTIETLSTQLTSSHHLPGVLLSPLARTEKSMPHNSRRQNLSFLPMFPGPDTSKFKIDLAEQHPSNLHICLTLFAAI